MNQNGEQPLREIHCSTCGRFLGFIRLVEGEVYLGPCKRCKQWTFFAEGETERRLTGEQIYAKLESLVRRKGLIAQE